MSKIQKIVIVAGGALVTILFFLSLYPDAYLAYALYLISVIFYSAFIGIVTIEYVTEHNKRKERRNKR